MTVDVVVDQVAGEDQGLQHAGPVFVKHKYGPVLLADDPHPLYEGLYFDQTVRDPRAPGVTDHPVEAFDVQGAEEYVPEEVFRGRQAVRRLVPAGDEPEDVVGFEVPFAAQDLGHSGVFDPTPAEFLERGRAGEVDPFDGRGVGVPAGVQKQRRCQGAPYVAVFQVRPRLGNAPEREAREVVDAYRVVQARVAGFREGAEGETELAHAFHAPQRVRLEKGFYRPVYGDVTPDIVPYSSARAPEELPNRTAQ